MENRIYIYVYKYISKMHVCKELFIILFSSCDTLALFAAPCLFIFFIPNSANCCACAELTAIAVFHQHLAKLMTVFHR